MTTQHTPGPWWFHLLAGNHDYAIYCEATGHDIALVRDANEANARLIAAAPELLAAAEALSDSIGKTMHKPIGQKAFEAGCVPWQIVEDLRAAIAKAHGEG